MDADVRECLEAYWEGLATIQETKLKLTEIAGGAGLTLEQLAERYGFRPTTLEPR